MKGGRANAVRTAIFSTYPPRACGIGTFAYDVRTALLGVADVEDVSALVVVDDPSSPQRPEILQTISQGARGDYVRAARTLGRLDIDSQLPLVERFHRASWCGAASMSPRIAP